MGNSNRLVLIHQNMEEVSFKGKIDLLLTPQFYTLKREAIPVKYAYQAKRIAPSLFEGLVEGKDKYHYLLSKEEEGWLFLAYNLVEIKDFLATKKIKPEDVGKIFFAQYALGTLSFPIALGEDEVLNVVENTVVVVPRNAFVSDELEMKFDDSIKVSHGISLGLETSSARLPLFHTIVLSLIFALFGVMYILEGLRYGGDTQEIEAKMTELLHRYPTLQSSYTRKSVSKKYQQRDKKERLKREKIKQLSKMVFKGSELTMLELSSTKVKASFKTENALRSKQVMRLVKEAHFKVKKSGNNLDIEGGL